MPCTLCPQNCAAARTPTDPGRCRAPQTPVVAKHMPHFWEEPPLSGTRGSGAIFFVGCNLRCVYCQNHAISQGAPRLSPSGATMEGLPPPRLAELFLTMQAQGVHNINLVTAAHFTPGIVEALTIARERGLWIPVVYNSNAYEKVETLRLLDGLIDIYLPDIKYADDEAAQKYSAAQAYFETACAAVLEMARQVGACRMEGGLMRRGLIIRHLVLPGRRKDAMRVLDWIAEHVPWAMVSLMSQYVPMHRAHEFPELNRRVTTFEYQSVVDYFHALGLQHGFVQDRTSAVGTFTPEFFIGCVEK